MVLQARSEYFFSEGEFYTYIDTNCAIFSEKVADIFDNSNKEVSNQEILTSVP